MPVPSSAVSTFREQWALRFIDAVTVVRETGRGTFNESTLVYDNGTSDTKHTGGALIRPFDAQGRGELFGDQLVTGKLYAVYIPHDALTAPDVFEPEDLVTITAALLDPALVGKTMRVLSVDQDSYITRNRLVCRLEEGVGYGD